MHHLAGASALALPAISLTDALAANSTELKKKHKAAIMLWMGGGPATINIWDLKPGAPTGGPFRPISTSGDLQICEYMPLMAKQMKHMSVIRSMSTREADHTRGRYYMHTGYVPNPNIEYPSYGSVISHELYSSDSGLEIPPFVAVGGGSVGPGFLGMSYAPFVVGSDGNVRNLHMDMPEERLQERMAMLDADREHVHRPGQSRRIESRDLAKISGSAADHARVLKKTVDLMTSKQMEAFKTGKEPTDVQERYGKSGFGRGCLMARRLVEQGVSFVEVDLGGWDTHMDNFKSLSTRKLPELDQAMAALVSRSGRAANVGRHRHHLDGRVRPHAADQRQFRPRPLGSQLERRRRRRRHEGWTGHRPNQFRRHECRDRALHLARRDGLGRQGARHFAGNDLHHSQRPPKKIANSGKVVKELFA